MAYNTVLVDQVKHTGVITLNRPEAMNTFSTEMAKELNQALIQLDNDQKIRVWWSKAPEKRSVWGLMYPNFLGNPRKNTGIGSDSWSR